MNNGTPQDYSDDLYLVYFEVAHAQETSQGATLEVLTSFLNDKSADQIVHLEHGYQMAMPMQTIPDVVRHLTEKNIAVYQVRRGKKVE
ncbi:hypothetical protein [Vibrio ezurae]|uniref:Uncharacterized protein n=1 Tax=Vibrio ezurae NBRC 102218 TaxID=1219080 RepID=U3B217_9VIBR|nr:hypothetical protein [Vibrio ezurae]GAD79487.1 hypothetical protein VEZ01S_16_00360 [Vibrio ezurae NBRC 102218]